MDRAELQTLLAEGLSLAQIGRRHGLHESTVGYWVKKHGLKAAQQEKHAARGGLGREELVALVETGATIAQIAEAVDRSKSTVRHWLCEYGLKTRRAVDSAQSGKTIVRECHRHGQTTFRLRSASGYRCLACRSEAVANRRRKVKQILVEEAGGRCRLCGYSRCIAALEFHHVDPADKLCALSTRGVTRSLERARAEASKCVLLCANCHAEVEAGVRALS